jgi:hypothetical protein
MQGTSCTYGAANWHAALAAHSVGSAPGRRWQHAAVADVAALPARSNVWTLPAAHAGLDSCAAAAARELCCSLQLLAQIFALQAAHHTARQGSPLLWVVCGAAAHLISRATHLCAITYCRAAAALAAESASTQHAQTPPSVPKLHARLLQCWQDMRMQYHVATGAMD